MSEDVIEFGAADRVSPQRPARVRRLPLIHNGSALSAAAASVLPALASLVLTWQTTVLPYDDVESRPVGAALSALGPVSAAYVMILSLLVACVVVTLFGQPAVRATARLIGYAFAGAGLAVVTSMAYSLSKTSNLNDFRLFPQEDLNNVKFTLAPGIYAAFLALLALGAALVLTTRPNPLPVAEARPAEEFDGAAPMELEVSVFPASPKTGPGKDHELYMRP